MKRYFQVSITVSEQEVREILIAQLEAIGYEAFEETGDLLKAFVEESLFDEAALVEQLQPHALTFELELLPVTNWNQEWEKNFQPVVIDDFCCIRASFHEPVSSVMHEIIITPKMSFGTGHHATTFMMVGLMRGVNFQDKYVFDFGTGTGILAILADKLNAKEVLAMDNDEWSMHNAAENLSANNSGRVRLLFSGNIPASKSFDIVLANINKQVIMNTLPQMIQQLSPDGIMLLSGLLESDLYDVNELAFAHGLKLQEQSSRSGWIALKYKFAHL